MHKIIFLPSLIDQLDVKPAQAFNNDGEILGADILLIRIGQWRNGWLQILTKVGQSDVQRKWSP